MINESRVLVANWDSKRRPHLGLGPAGGFAPAAAVRENMFLWQGSNLLPAKASFCFCQEEKVKSNNVRNYFLPNLKSAVVVLHHQLHAHAQLRKSTSTHAKQPQASGLEIPSLRSPSAEMNGYTDGKQR